MKRIIILAVFLSLGFVGPVFSDRVSDSLRTLKPGAGSNFTECAAVRMKEITLKLLSQKEKFTTKIPEGWTVVGGTGGQGHPKLLICR